MIKTSIGTLQVGSPWLSRQWVNSVPGVQVTSGITQNNLTIRAGSRRPSVTTSRGWSGTSGGTGGNGGNGGTGGNGGNGGDGGDDGGDNTYLQ